VAPPAGEGLERGWEKVSLGVRALLSIRPKIFVISANDLRPWRNIRVGPPG
jgi:hypothetical protein